MKTLHYGTDQWQNFKSRTSETPETYAMEAHLLECDSCREIYLNLFLQEELNQALNIIPPDFTDSLIAKIELPPPVKARPLYSRPVVNRKGIFAYYVTAAAVTLVLMSGGVFDSMANQSVRFSHVWAMQSRNFESRVSRDWSSKLLKDGTIWMQNQSFSKERKVKNAK